MGTPGVGARPLAHDQLDRLVALLHSLDDGFVLLDVELRIQWLNVAAEFLLGRSGEEVIGKGLADVLPPLHQSEAFAEFCANLWSGHEANLDLQFPAATGWFELHAMPAGGGVVTTLRDISDRRRRDLLIAGNRDVLSRIAENAPLTSILDAVVLMVEEQSQHRALASVLVASEDGRHLLRGSAPSLPADYNAAVNGIEIGPKAGSCGTAAFRREQVIVEDIGVDPLWDDYRHLALAAGLRACWSTPIFSAEGEFLATFAIYYTEPRRPEPADQRLIEQITRTVAIAIQNDRSRRQLHRAVTLAEAAWGRSRRLNALTTDLAAATTPDEVSTLTCSHARDALRLRAARIDPDVRDPALSGPSQLRLVLRSGSRVLGHLVIERAPDDHFTADDVEQAATIAAIAAQALSRAVEYEQTRQVAETLQRSLLSEPPHLDALQIEVGYRPAARTAQVGGDWYDTFVLPGDRLAVVIGDVMGHDIAAAAAMGQLRNMVRAVAVDADGDPADVLTRLDRLVERLGVASFATLVYAELTPRADGRLTLRWCNAGHPPPLLVSGSGDVQVLQTPGAPPVGAVRQPVRFESTTTVAPGGTLVLYTDGLVETRTELIDDRIADLVRHAAASAGRPLPAFRDALLDFVEQPADDIALVTVRSTTG